jgi:hypothetical protein
MNSGKQTVAGGDNFFDNWQVAVYCRDVYKLADEKK